MQRKKNHHIFKNYSKSFQENKKTKNESRKFQGRIKEDLRNLAKATDKSPASWCKSGRGRCASNTSEETPVVGAASVVVDVGARYLFSVSAHQRNT
jgi:hypothetical protein